MKRFMSVLLAAILTLSAMSALADVTFKTDYYTLTMPDEWVVDTDNLEADSLDGMDALGYLYAPGELGLAISAYLMRFEDEEGVSPMLLFPECPRTECIDDEQRECAQGHWVEIACQVCGEVREHDKDARATEQQQKQFMK